MIRRNVLAACAASALMLMQPLTAPAHEGGSHAHIAVPETSEAVHAEIKKQHEALTAAVTGKNLKAVHDLAENMTALAKALPEKVTEEKKAVVQTTTDNMIKLLDSLHHAADSGSQPRSGIEFKKLDAVVTALNKQLQ